MKTCGIILAGGKSSRMGQDKSLLKLNDKYVLDSIISELACCTDELMIVANEPSLYAFTGLNVVMDRYKGMGPLAGLETAIFHGNADVYITAACDMPFVNRGVYDYLLEQLGNYDAAVPVYHHNIHPLSGIYRDNILPAVQIQLEQGMGKMKALCSKINSNYVGHYGTIKDSKLNKHFFNMNNPHQYEEAKYL